MKSKEDSLAEQKERIRVYCTLMEEVRVRLQIIDTTQANQFNYPPAMVREICYLELRIICEIIAMGCLVLHGDIQEADAIRGIYQPGKIISKLERLNSDFHPQPTSIQIGPDRLIKFIATPEVDHLSKNELIELWGTSGDILHRSPMDKVFKKWKIAHDDFSDVFSWRAKIIGLLGIHWISLPFAKKGLLTVMNGPGGKPQIALHDFSKSEADVSIEIFSVE